MAGYRFQPQRQRPVLSNRPDVRVGEDPREIEMTRRETTSSESETASTADMPHDTDYPYPIRILAVF